MRRLLSHLIIFVLCLLFALPAFARETRLHMLITDTDPKGTNVRASPGGKVIRVIPYGGTTDEEVEMRAVIVTGQDKSWFRVILSDDSTGWMHGSVLGSCPAGTEDGDPHLYAVPDENSAEVAVITDSVPLALLAVQDNWAQVEYVDASGKKIRGWLMEQCLFSNPYNDCRSK